MYSSRIKVSGSPETNTSPVAKQCYGLAIHRAALGQSRYPCLSLSVLV